MRLVVDTNVLVPAFPCQGAPCRLIELATDDDAVLACALAARADLIVSGDDDLLSLKHYQDIPIVTPAHALQLIGPA